MSNIFLIRHAESEFNTKESTSLDSRLTIEGLNQAYKTGRFLDAKMENPQSYQIITSPFRRTLQTALVVKFHTQVRLPIVEDWRLREHIYSNCGYVEEQFPMTIYGHACEYELNEVDTDEAILERLKNFWNGLDKNRNYIIISHGTPIQTLGEFARGNFLLPKWDKTIKNCSITHVKDGNIVLDKYGEHL